MGLAAGALAFCATISASTSFSVMKPRFDGREVDPVQLGELGRSRVAFRPPGAAFGAGFVGVRVDLCELGGRLRDVRDRLAQLDLDVKRRAARWFPNPRLDSTVAFVVSTTHTLRRHLRAILDEPLGEERVLGVRVLARENDLEHAR